MTQDFTEPPNDAATTPEGLAPEPAAPASASDTSMDPASATQPVTPEASDRAAWAAPTAAQTDATTTTATLDAPASAPTPALPNAGPATDLGDAADLTAPATDSDPYAAAPAAPGTSDPSGAYGPYGTTEAPRRPRGARFGPIIAVATVLALLAGILGGVLGYAIADQVDSNTTTDASLVLPQAPEGASSERPSDSIAGIAASSLPAVVSLAVRGASEQGTGSGFVIRENGYILTNNHVVDAAASGGSITTSFQDGSTAQATIVGRDQAYDLAVIKVDRTGLPVLPLGNSNNVVVGDTAIAVGSPLGLSGTVTAGIVSALDRPVTAGGSGIGETSFINAIQTDAAINPGNSGGPLLNAGGDVIGINSAIATLGAGQGGQGGSIGVGFAIPVNQAKITAEQIIQTGTSTKPVIGVTLDQTFAGPGVRISVGANGQPGVVAGGPAEQAGVRPGDVVTEVDGRAVNGVDEFIVAIRAKQPGDVITLTIDRNGSDSEVKVTLGSETSGN